MRNPYRRYESMVHVEDNMRPLHHLPPKAWDAIGWKLANHHGALRRPSNQSYDDWRAEKERYFSAAADCWTRRDRSAIAGMKVNARAGKEG